MTVHKHVIKKVVPPSNKGTIFTSSKEVQRLESHQSLWDKLASKSRRQDPFCCSSIWQMSFHEAFTPDRNLIIRKSSDSMIAFAEYEYLADIIILTPIDDLWCFGDNLLGQHAVDLLSDTLIDIEKFYAPVFPNLIISGIPPKGVLFNRLLKRFSKDFDFYRESSNIQCAASLSDGLDGYLSRRSGKHRRKINKLSRRVKELGVTFERHIPITDEIIDKVYARMIAVELTSWKGIGKCGMAEPRPKKFYDIMLKRLAVSKGARVIFAKHEGEDIGFIFGGMVGKIYRGQQFSYHEGWSKASVGSTLQAEQIKWLCEEGANRYDMGPLLGNRMEYKKHWAEKKFHIETWILEKK